MLPQVVLAPDFPRTILSHKVPGFGIDLFGIAFHSGPLKKLCRDLDEEVWDDCISCRVSGIAVPVVDEDTIIERLREVGLGDAKGLQLLPMVSTSWE